MVTFFKLNNFCAYNKRQFSTLIRKTDLHYEEKYYYRGLDGCHYGR